MATWPSGTKAGTSNLDAGTDSPRLARPDIKQNVDNVNSIIDMFNIDSPSANEILKYNSGNARFELGSDTGSNGINVVGDDSATITIADAGTLYVQGGTNITTSTNSDGTLTVNAPSAVSSFTNDSGFITNNGNGDLTIIGSTITAPSNADFTLTTSGTGTLDLDDTVRFNKNYKEDINTLTSSSTITVDCTAASVHDVTLASSTQFVITSLPVGGTVTLIITSDSTGSYTASFGTDDSTTVKFAGGSPTISTDGGSTDIVSIFHANGQYYGNIAKDFKTS